uniref:Interleukin-1 receptor-associated kinase 2 n=1 Tax=Mus musculus TaxID=10090 RepID=A0A0N4SUW3_MOUSE
MACYIYQLPSWVLDDLCRNIDTLSEWDWMQFASYVITDLTQLRKIKSMERVQGGSRFLRAHLPSQPSQRL